MQQAQTEAAAGRQLAMFGADLAMSKADRVTDGEWSAVAWNYLIHYGKRQNGQAFMAEDVRAAAQREGAVATPPDGRAWGAIFMRAARARLISRIGYAPMKAPKCHANPKAVWIWVG